VLQETKLRCAPANKNGEDPMNNQLGPTELDASKPSLLCVAATGP
jgi:hypothetical protein